MLKKRKPSTQSWFLMATLNEQCDPRHLLRKLGERIPWGDFEEAFGSIAARRGEFLLSVVDWDWERLRQAHPPRRIGFP